MKKEGESMYSIKLFIFLASVAFSFVGAQSVFARGIVIQEQPDSSAGGFNVNATGVAQVFVAERNGFAQTLEAQDTAGFYGNFGIQSPTAIAHLYAADHPNAVTENNLLATSGILLRPSGRFRFVFSNPPFLEAGRTYIWIVSFASTGIPGSTSNFDGSNSDSFNGKAYAGFSSSGWLDRSDLAPKNYYFVLSGEEKAFLSILSPTSSAAINQDDGMTASLKILSRDPMIQGSIFISHATDTDPLAHGMVWASFENVPNTPFEERVLVLQMPNVVPSREYSMQAKITEEDGTLIATSTVQSEIFITTSSSSPPDPTRPIVIQEHLAMFQQTGVNSFEYSQEFFPATSGFATTMGLPFVGQGFDGVNCFVQLYKVNATSTVFLDTAERGICQNNVTPPYNLFNFPRAPILRAGQKYKWVYNTGDHVERFGSTNATAVFGSNGGILGGRCSIAWKSCTFTLFQNPSLLKEPVIIVPGTMGSRLNRVSDGVEVWPDVNRMFGVIIDLEDNYLNELKLDSSGNQIQNKEMNASSVIDKETVTRLGIPLKTETFYGDLINNFGTNGYIPGITLFVAPFDWRLDVRNATSISDLASIVERAKANSYNGKVNIIAHSLGTLLVEQYLERATSTGFIDKLIFLGSPHLGTPLAFKVLNYGDTLDLKWGILGLNPNKAKDITQNMLSIYEMLPGRTYFTRNVNQDGNNENGGYVVDLRDERKVLAYNETSQFLGGAGRNNGLLFLSDVFHRQNDGPSLISSSTQLYNIVGCRLKINSTIGGFNIYNEDTSDSRSFSLRPTDGDGTVPLISADSFANDRRTYYALGIKHVGLVKDTSTLAVIQNILHDTPDDPVGDISQNQFDCSSINRSYIISSHSPVKLHVYDSQDRHLGPTGEGGFDASIPDSDYQTIEGDNFAYLPTGDTYRVVLEGTASGTANFDIQYFSGLNMESKITYFNVPIDGVQTRAEINLSDTQGDVTLRLDSNGDGTPDATILPNAILSGMQAGDFIPPDITFPLIPTELILNTTITLNFSITDDNSGISISTAILDGHAVASGDVVTMSNLGEHLLKITAIDRAGNPAVKEFTFKVIYKFGGFSPPLVTDGVSTVRKGDTVPIAFQLADARGNFISTATPRLFIAQIPPGSIPAQPVGGSSNGDENLGAATATGSSSNGDDAQPECTDGIDNDGDDKVDAADPACHTDGNASNVSSYDLARAGENSAPVLTLVGQDPTEVTVGQVYVDLGATAYDEEEGDITSRIAVSGLPVNTSTIGSATTTYSVSDSLGRAAWEVVRRVNVVGPEILVPPKLLAGAKSLHYDQKKNSYTAGLLTNSLTMGLWRLRVVLDDGKNYIAVIKIENPILKKQNAKP